MSEAATVMADAPDESGQRFGYIALDKIKNELPQVRRDWRHDDGQQKLEELTESIRQHGVLQPIEVSPREDGGYDVLVGHRRYAAAKRAGIKLIPAVARNATEEERTLLQLTENIQRQDLSPLDQGEAMVVLLEEHGYSIMALAERLGISHHTVRSKVRVFKDDLLRDAVQRGLITSADAGHLATLTDPYDEPLRAKLRAGSRVSRQDIRAVRAHQGRDGVVHPHNYSKCPPGTPDEVIREATNARIRQAVDLHQQGLSHLAIAKKMGLGKTTIGTYLQNAEGRLAESRAEQPTGPIYATPKVSPLPWENEPPTGLAVTVDERGTVIEATPVTSPTLPKPTEPAERPPLDTSEPHYGRNPEHVVMGPPAPRTAIVPTTPPVDPDVRRLGFMLAGLPEPCQDTMAAMLQLGMERGWSCSELNRRYSAALRLQG